MSDYHRVATEDGDVFPGKSESEYSFGVDCGVTMIARDIIHNMQALNGCEV